MKSADGESVEVHASARPACEMTCIGRPPSSRLTSPSLRDLFRRSKMRKTLKVFSCVVAICAGLFIASGNSVWPEEAAQGGNPRIKELQQKRLAVLEAIRDSAQTLFSHGKLPYDDIHAASVDLLGARLAYARTRDERIQICDEAVKEAVAAQEIAQGMFERALTTRIPVLKAEAYVLKTQIDRQNAETDK